MPDEKPDSPGGIWVLETQTKGTGANVVPLDKVLRKPGASDSVPGFAFRKPERGDPQPPSPRVPHRFKLTDVMTRQVLVEDVDVRGAIEALEGLRSIVDVIVHVWEPAPGRWRMLSLGETQALWDWRGNLEPPA